MPPITRLARLAVSPAVRAALLAGVRSPRARELARRAATDRKSLYRTLSDPATLRAIASSATARSTARAAAGRVGSFAIAPDELPTAVRIARAGLVFVPLRWMPAAWLGLWAVRRLSRGRGPGRRGGTRRPFGS